MKKTMSVLIWSLFALTTLQPTGSLIAVCFGYSLELISTSVFAFVIGTLSVFAVALEPVFRSAFENKTLQILLAILTPLSLINAAIYIFNCPQIWVIAHSLISAACCCILSVKHTKPLGLKITALALSAVIAYPVALFGFLSLVMGDFGANTVVETVESPSGKYYAQVIDSDQGALGGDTFVEVHSKPSINAILFKIKKKKQRVYSGEWGEYEYMRIYWEDDEHLVINSYVYQIK